MNRFSVGLVAAFLAALTISTPLAQTKAPAGRIEMTVDSIMRGPDLVGYPPTELRWSGDSSKLYFEWRKPGEEEASTYVVDKDGGEPKKLSAEEAKVTPPGNGRWDKAR